MVRKRARGGQRSRTPVCEKYAHGVVVSTLCSAVRRVWTRQRWPPLGSSRCPARERTRETRRPRPRARLVSFAPVAWRPHAPRACTARPLSCHRRRAVGCVRRGTTAPRPPQALCRSPAAASTCTARKAARCRRWPRRASTPWAPPTPPGTTRRRAPAAASAWVACSTPAGRAVMGARTASRSPRATARARQGTSAPLAPPPAGRRPAAAAPPRPTPHRATVPRALQTRAPSASATTLLAAPRTHPTCALGKACVQPVTSALAACWYVTATHASFRLPPSFCLCASGFAL
jgi:hypothetical protein